MKTLARLALGLSLVLASPGLSVAYTLFERPTAVFDPASPTSWVLDGRFAMLHWLAESMPILFRVNPESPGPVIPLIVREGRDPNEEFVAVIRRSFERWDRHSVETSSLEFRFAGLTNRPAGVLDGESVVGWSEPDGCPPFAAVFNITYRITVPAPLPDTDPLLTTSAFPDVPPFTIDVGDGHFVEVREPGQILESDTVICASVPFSTNRTPGTGDLEGVATHEQGHFGGLHHSPLAAATMGPASDPVEGELDDTFPGTLTLDDRAAVSHLYPARRDQSGTIEGRVTVGSLLPGLPSPPPFVGIPLAPGSPAYAVHVVAVNVYGLVEASAMTREDGRFVIWGLQGRPPYTLILTPLGFPRTGHYGASLTSSPLVSFRALEMTGVGPGEAVELVVDEALPSRRDVFGIGDTVPPPPFLEFVASIQDDPSTSFVEADLEFGGIILRRGQLVGSSTETPIPGLFDGSLWIGATASDFDAAPASIDLGPDISVIGEPVVFFQFFGLPGQVTNVDILFRAQVGERAQKGLRNIVIVDRAGRRLILPGVIEVR